jgi:trimethylamine--corrinoid protein Co-methyltransferase
MGIENINTTGLSLKVLNKTQIMNIHSASLEILRRTGVRVFENEALNILKDNGCFIEDGNLVKMPAALVEWAIDIAPSQVTICNRNGEPTMFLQNDNVYFGPGSDCPFIMDPYTNERRKFVKKDIEDVAKLCDYLPNIDFACTLGIASDVTSERADRHHFEAMLLNTSKPVIFTAMDLNGLMDIVKMSVEVYGSLEKLQKDPFLLLFSPPVAPLRHPKEGMQKLLYMAENKLPIAYVAGVLAGATGPVTMAGSLAQANAEILSGLVISQLKRKGTPCLHGGAILLFDMKTGEPSYGAPEMLLMTAAFTDIAKYYELPMFSYSGVTDSKVLDQQAAIESAFWILFPALSGGHLAHDIGFMESGVCGSMELIVLCDEVIGMIKKIRKGILVNKETLALDVINKVGSGGTFIDTDHTFNNFKKNWQPNFFDRFSYEFWKNNGGLSVNTKLNNKVKEILENHVSKKLDIEVVEKMHRIVEGVK